MVIYVPGTEETDPKKQNMSLQQLGGATSTLQASVATNTTNIATNTASIATINAAWTGYTPTVSSQGGTITTASATGRYKQIGKTVFVTVSVTVTTAGTGTGYLQASLPGGITAAAASFMGSAQEVNVTGHGGSAQVLSGATIIKSVDSAGVTFIANGAVVHMSCTFEST